MIKSILVEIQSHCPTKDVIQFFLLLLNHYSSNAFYTYINEFFELYHLIDIYWSSFQTINALFHSLAILVFGFVVKLALLLPLKRTETNYEHLHMSWISYFSSICIFVLDVPNFLVLGQGLLFCEGMHTHI